MAQDFNHTYAGKEEKLLSSLDDAYTQRVLADMIRIDSIVGNEELLARYLLNELQQLSIQSELTEVEPGRPNVYARLGSPRPGKRLHLNGHMDTVPVCAGWTVSPFEPLVRRGSMYGLGACDMKGGIACLLNVLRAFKLMGLPFQGELSFSAVIDEEAYSKGAKAVLETDFAACDTVLIAEPYTGEADSPIPLGILGKILYDVTVKGRAAHGFSPEMGVNAIEEAARIISALDHLQRLTHPDFGTGSTCTLKIEGGYQVYSVVVPDRCRFEVNRMLVPGESSRSALHELEVLVQSLGLKSEVEIKLKPPMYESFVMEPTLPALHLFQQVYTQVTGEPAHFAHTKGITDANVFTGEAGIPSLHIGPRRGNVHQPDEYVPLESLKRTSEIIARFALCFLTEI